MAIATINPATGETVKTFDPEDAREVERKVALAAETFASYRRTGYAERAGRLRAAADLMAAEADELAATVTTEMGKPLAAAKAEAAKCVKTMRYYAEHAERFLADVARDADAVGASRAFTRYQPMGVVLAVMPWNFPLFQVVRFAAPALMAGNVGLLKHASNVPQTALYLGELFARGGFPAGCFQTLLVGSDAIEKILRDERVAAATLTGSEPAGRAVAVIAADEIKKTVLELGGADAFVVTDAANLDAAVETAVKARVQNCGQSCIAAKRFIVQSGVYDEFASRFTAAMQALTTGDPMDDGTDVGPLCSERGRADLEELVDDAKAGGASVLCGGERLDRSGWYYPPTVLADVTDSMRVYREETFGPVATLFKVSTVDEALAVANATSFGLGSNAWTDDPDEQERFVEELDAGQVFINGMTTSYSELPFGGVKRSGYGRELADLGIKEFCNAKTVWIG